MLHKKVYHREYYVCGYPGIIPSLSKHNGLDILRKLIKPQTYSQYKLCVNIFSWKIPTWHSHKYKDHDTICRLYHTNKYHRHENRHTIAWLSNNYTHSVLKIKKSDGNIRIRIINHLT